ncbi:hypothetical protein V6Z11_D05G203500 [Gossypium hirsutum]
MSNELPPAWLMPEQFSWSHFLLIITSLLDGALKEASQPNSTTCTPIVILNGQKPSPWPNFPHKKQNNVNLSYWR